jgi:hypothetical protein
VARETRKNTDKELGLFIVIESGYRKLPRLRNWLLLHLNKPVCTGMVCTELLY